MRASRPRLWPHPHFAVWFRPSWPPNKRRLQMQEMYDEVVFCVVVQAILPMTDLCCSSIVYDKDHRSVLLWHSAARRVREVVSLPLTGMYCPGIVRRTPCCVSTRSCPCISQRSCHEQTANSRCDGGCCNACGIRNRHPRCCSQRVASMCACCSLPGSR